MKLIPVLLFAICSLPVYSADIFEQLLEKKTGRGFNAIVLRDKSGKFIVATPTGTKAYAKLSYRRNSSSQTITRDIDAILSSVENWIRKSRFPQALDELPRLERALTDFEAEADLKLQSSVTSEADKKSLRSAKAFYRDMQKAFKPTIDTLGLSREMMASLQAIGDRNLKQDEFLTILRKQANLKGITRTIDLAKMERNEAISSSEKKLKKATETYIKNAAKDAGAAKPDVRSSMSIMALFERASAIDPAYEGLQTQVMKPLMDRSESIAKSLTDAVYAGFSFIKFPEMNRDKFTAAVKKLRETSQALSFLQRSAYGKKGPEARAAMKARVVANDKAVDEAEALYKKLNRVPILYREAVSFHSRALYDKAINRMTEAKQAAVDAKVLSTGLRNDMETKIIEYEGEGILNELRSPEKSSVDVLGALIKKADAFVKEHSRDGRLKLPFEEFGRRTKELQGLMALLPKLDELKESSPLAAHQKVELYLDLQTKILDKSQSIHPAAEKILTDRWSKDSVSIFKKAGKGFLADTWALDSSQHERVFLKLIESMLAAKEYSVLESIIGKAYTQIDGRPKDFISRVVDSDAKMAFAISLKDLGMAMKIFDRIKANQPEIYERLDLNTRLQKLLLQQANQFREAKRFGDAVQIYEKICEANPDFASLYDVFKILFGLKVQLDPTILNDREKRRGLLQEYCEKYGYRMADVGLLQAEKKAILKELLALWNGGKDPLASVETFGTYMEAVPGILKETKLTEEYFAEIRNTVSKLKNRVERSRLDENSGAAVIPVPNPVLTALKKLRGMGVNFQYEKNNLHVLYATLTKAKAEEYLERDRFQTANELLKEIQSEYPDLAETLEIGKTLEAYDSQLLLERIREPLHVRGKKELVFGSIPGMYLDFGALLFWIVFWGVYLLNAVTTGRAKERASYNVKHFACVFAVFALLMVFFLEFGKLYHLQATLLALLVPAIIFHAISMVSYAFFPLVYEGRKLGLKKFVLKVPVLGSSLTGLAEKVKVEEADLPLLEDPLAYKIVKASRLKKRELAVEKLTKFLEKLKNSKKDSDLEKLSKAELYLGIALCDLGRENEAEPHLAKHVEMKGHEAEGHWQLGLIKFKTKRFESAVEDFKHCLAERGGDKELMAKLGRCYFETGKFKSALKCFDTVDDQSRDTRFYKARALARIGRLDDSVACYQELLKDAPDDPRTLYSLASSFAVMGKDVKALKVIGHIKEGTEFHPHAVGLQGSIFLRNGKIAKAKDHFYRALEEEENLVAVLHGLGQLLLEDGDLDEAQEKFEKVLEVEPFNGAAAFHLAATLTKKGERPDFSLFEKAMEDPQLRPLASVAAAREKFYEEDYAATVELYEQGEKGKAAMSVRDHYMRAFSRLAQKDFDAVRASLDQLGATIEDGQQEPFLASAFYELGRKLMGERMYKDAIKAFTFVKKAASGNADVAKHMEKMLAEASMRSVFELLRENSLVRAVKLTQTMAMLPESLGYSKRAAYYTAVLNLRRGNFMEAEEQLSSLLQKHPEDKRIIYHLSVAQTGNEKLDEARGTLAQLESAEDMSDFLKAGIAEVKAFLLAADGKLTEAEQVMAELKPFADSPEGAFLNKRIRLTRADFLCRIHDSARLQFLLADMDESEKAQAAYLQAVSALQGGEIATVVKNLSPFADKTPENTKLFAVLSAKLAKQMLNDGNRERAIATLEKIKKPPECVTVLLNHMKIADIMASIDTPQDVRESIVSLEKMYESTSDIELQSMVIHNLFVLKFKLPMLMEDFDTWDGCEKAWSTFMAFKKAMTDNLDYWNSRLERMQRDAEIQPFVDREVQHFMSDFNASTLLPAYVGRALAALQQDNPTHLNRHIVAIIKLGREEDKLKEFVQRLGITAKHYSDSLPKSDPLQKTWGFVIGYLMIQISVREALNPKEKSPLRSQLESYLSVREFFGSPSDFLNARKSFNTNLLDALQTGIEGKFSKSGDAIEKSLVNIPPGIKLDSQLESALWTLREQARKPSAADEQGVNIAQEFERIYQRVLNFSIQRGA